jgi:hypothetical protein
MNYRFEGRNLTKKEIKEQKRSEADARNNKTHDNDRKKNRK